MSTVPLQATDHLDTSDATTRTLTVAAAATLLALAVFSAVVTTIGDDQVASWGRLGADLGAQRHEPRTCRGAAHHRCARR